MREPTIPGMQVQFLGPEPDTGGWINADDVMAHVKTLDVALNGPGGATRPLLIDLVSQMEDIARKLGRPIVEAQNWPATVDRNQIIYALERAQMGLSAKGDELASAGDYSAEFYSEDADRMKEAIALITEGMLGVKPAPAELSEKVQLIKSGLMPKIHAFVAACQKDPMAICGVPAFALQGQVEQALRAAVLASAAGVEVVSALPDAARPPDFRRISLAEVTGFRTRTDGWTKTRLWFRKVYNGGRANCSCCGEPRSVIADLSPPFQICPACWETATSPAAIASHQALAATPAGAVPVEPFQKTAEHWLEKAHVAMSALRELIDCKDMKDAIARADETTPEVAALEIDYARRKPLAWAAARDVLKGAALPLSGVMQGDAEVTRVGEHNGGPYDMKR